MMADEEHVQLHRTIVLYVGRDIAVLLMLVSGLRIIKPGV